MAHELRPNRLLTSHGLRAPIRVSEVCISQCWEARFQIYRLRDIVRVQPLPEARRQKLADNILHPRIPLRPSQGYMPWDHPAFTIPMGPVSKAKAEHITATFPRLSITAENRDANNRDPRRSPKSGH